MVARRTERDVALLPERARKPETDRTGARRRLNGTTTTVTPEPRLNFHPAIDELPEEQRLTIEVNGRPAATLTCSPMALRELAVGWTYGRGLIDGASGIGRISEFPGRVSIMVDDATRLPPYDGPVADDREIGQVLPGFLGAPPASLADLERDPTERTGWMMEREPFLTVAESLFERLRQDHAAQTNHIAAATDGAGICIAARDLSRQNAVDKVIGWTILQEQDRSRLMLCVTGQVNAAMVASIWRAGFPLVTTTCAPTADAVEIAESAGITIVGRVLRQDRAVYTHGWRLPVSIDERPVIKADPGD